tara:strand:- start:773 stop:1624 length:852 start_codon:yes stop_codon:yes gene_type:complete
MHHLIAKNRYSLLNAGEIALDSQWNYTNIASPFYRLYFIESGSGSVIISDQEIHLLPGYLYLIPDFTLANYSCNDHLHQFYIHFEEELATGVSLKSVYKLHQQVLATDLDIALVKKLITTNPDRILQNHRPTIFPDDIGTSMQNKIREMESRGILLQLLARFLSEVLFNDRASSTNESRLVKSLQFIHAHLSSDLSVEQLASEASLNPDYYSRIFCSLFGIRPIPYIHRLRIQRAQNLLLFSEATHDEIADAVGFSNRPYFAKIFKRYTGKTVGQYRQQVRAI